VSVAQEVIALLVMIHAQAPVSALFVEHWAVSDLRNELGSHARRSQGQRIVLISANTIWVSIAADASVSDRFGMNLRTASCCCAPTRSFFGMT
jgi:hypothetical protein